MRSVVLLCVVVASLVSESVVAQHFSSYYTLQHLRNRRQGGASISSVVRAYEPVVPVKERDVGTGDKVRLDVFYETDCPDSMRFFTNQLFPVYQELEDVVDIHLVPYGKANERYNEAKQKYDFTCQHGESECYGNTVQSCVISLYPKKKDYMSFINCMETYPRPSRNGAKCARRQSLDWNKIDKCATGDEGNRLLHEMAQRTENLNPRLYFVPWILVNGNFNRRTHRWALGDLKGVVCSTYKGNNPKCK